jgi:hypothetical protein
LITIFVVIVVTSHVFESEMLSNHVLRMWLLLFAENASVDNILKNNQSNENVSNKN